MAIYGKIVNGRTIDVFNTRDASGNLPAWAGTDQDFVDRLRPGSILLPDGTLDCAIDNGDGTYTNPTIPTPPVIYRKISKTEFSDYCYAQLGGGITGIDRFGAILKAAAVSTNDGVYAALDRYKSANTILKENAAIFIALLQSDGILTQQEANNVINNWPVQ
jgi:hypothetical protein